LLSNDEVEQQEEALRKEIMMLSDESKIIFYSTVKKKIKDPDTYAALNWFFVAGLHHFYLGKWIRGLFDLITFILGLALIIAGHVEIGLALIFVISIIELWALFRSQIIIQDLNNQTYRNELRKVMGSE
jgi:TM2 domain-containing membrane protein YozV